MSNGESLAIYNQAKRINDLESMLKTVTNELHNMLDKDNERLSRGVKITDESPPELNDYQTIYEANKLLDSK